MFGNGDERAEPDENPTELVMKKQDEFIHIWVVVDGEEIFHAAPHVKMVKGSASAAVQTFLSRAFQREIEALADTDDGKGVF